jgi:hypothetical protein
VTMCSAFLSLISRFLRKNVLPEAQRFIWLFHYWNLTFWQAIGDPYISHRSTRHALVLRCM